jgi:hypothetical protein
MREGTRTAPLAEGRAEEGIVKRAIAAAAQVTPKDRVRTGLEAVIDFAETDPAAARAALSALRGNHRGLARLEQATLSLGAAIQVALTELASPAPNLRRRLPELERWLEGDW